MTTKKKRTRKKSTRRKRLDGAPARQPKKHEVQCKACGHALLSYVEEEWCRWRLADAEAAQILGVSRRAWQRHAAYVGLYDQKAARKSRRYALLRAAELGLASRRATVDTTIRAISEMRKEEDGGERHIVTFQGLAKLKASIEQAAKEGKLPPEALKELRDLGVEV